MFAVVRVDGNKPDTESWNNRITVKEIIWTQDEAVAEVERLNKLNSDKNAVYFWRATRLWE